MRQISFEVYENRVQSPHGPDNRRQLAVAKQAMLQILREQLSPRQKQMILLYFFEKRNIPQIAADLGINKSTVSRTLARALHNLRKKLYGLQLR